MAFADTAKLIVDLSLKGNFNTQLKASERALGSFDAKLSKTEGRAYRAGQQIGTGIKNAATIAAVGVGFLASQVVLGLNSLAKLDDVTTQTNAVLKSTGAVAGQTATSVRKLAEQYESLNATISDEVIQSGENLLLTFTNIRKEAFEPALKAALDMNTALGRGEEGLTGTIQQLGVALNDPIRGLTRLQRAGITFTATQKAQIQAAVEAGDTFKAQGIILEELNKRFGGSFLAGGSTTTGKIAKFKDAIEDLQRALASALLPTLGKVADRLSAFLQDPQVVKTIEGLGQSIADLFSDKNLAEGGKILGTVFETAKAAAPVIKDAAVATLGVVKAAVGLFTSLPKEVQQLAIGAFAINKITGGLVTNVAGGLISSVLKQLVSGVVNVQGAVVNVVGAGLPGVPSGAPLAPAAGKGIIGQIVDALPKLGAAAGFGLLTQQTIAAGVEQGIIGADGHLMTHRENGHLVGGAAPGGSPTTIGGAITRALVNLGLEPAINAGNQQAELDARRIEAAENRQTTTVSGHLSALNREFKDKLAALTKATKDNDVAKFAKALAKDITGGKGSAGSTKDTLKTLQGKLAQTHDPKTAAILRAAIRQVQAKLPNREWVQGQLDAAKKIASGTESEKRKLDQLNAIQRSLRQRGDTHAANEVAKLRDVAKRVDKANRDISADTRSEGAGIRQSIRDKDLSVTNYVSVTAKLSLSETLKTQTTFKKISGFIQK